MTKKKLVKLHLACGPNIVAGWDNLDILRNKGIIHHDLRKRLPYKDGTVDLIFHEHFIEHLTKTEAEFFLAECYRVLKPGGVMRVGWPDLKRLLNAYFLKKKSYIDYVFPQLWSHRYGRDWDELFSDCIFGWEHRYAYTSSHLQKVILSAGFNEVKVMKAGVSDFNIALDFRRDPATTYLEATKR